MRILLVIAKFSPYPYKMRTNIKLTQLTIKNVAVMAVITLIVNCIDPEINYYSLFEKHEVSGSILLYDLQSGEYSGHNLSRTDSLFIPASTFKILNSLIALETGAISSVDEIIPWDKIDRGWDKWDMDHSLRSAIKYSAVWFYQELAGRIGQEQMQLWIDRVGYGNQNISGGITKFWLSGGLRISQRQQIEFLVNLYQNKLPFSASTIDAVKEILILEETHEFVLRGKTGWAKQFETDIGWFVGYVTQAEKVCFFATGFSGTNPPRTFTSSAKALTREVIFKLGYAPILKK